MTIVDTCLHCEEPVEATDDRRSILDGMTGQRRWQHLECAMRMVTGSVAHINRQCSCYIRGSDRGDPPGMSRRQAARAAWLAYQRVSLPWPDPPG